MKKKALLSSILTIALCLSLIVGSTFALFTSTSGTNVAVTAGKVDVVATIENIKLGTVLDSQLPETHYEIANGNELILKYMVPGDFITFDLKVENKSDVTVLYRTLLKVAKNTGLWEGLTVTIDETSYDGLTKVSNWVSLAPQNHPDTVSVKIALPKDAGNEYQGKTCSVNYTVEAIQGNASVADPDADVTYIYTANDLIAFSTNVATGNYYEGKTVLLMNDIDLAGSNFNGIGTGDISAYGGRTFWGTFDGQGYTISNMNVTSNTPKMAAAGLFSTVGNNAVIKNVKLVNAVVNSTKYAGGIVGYVHTGNGSTVTIENCQVTGSSVTSAPELVGAEYDNGDKVGGIVGYTVNATINNCKVENTVLSGYRDIGGIVGYANKGSVITNNSIDNVTVTINLAHNYKNYTTLDKHDANSIIGEIDPEDSAYVKVENNTGTATVTSASIVYSAGDMTDAIKQGGNIVIANDIVMTGDWTPIKVDTPSAYYQISETLYIDGNGHSISGLNHSLIGSMAARNITIKNLTIKDSNITGVGKLNDTSCGAFVSYLDNFNYSLTLDNCHTMNVNVTATYDENNKDDTGLGAGALVGYNGGVAISISNCSVTGGSVVNSNGNAAGIIGYCQLGGNATISNCTVSGVTITGEANNKEGQIAGTVTGSSTLEINGCTYDSTYKTVGRVISGTTVKVNGTPIN